MHGCKEGQCAQDRLILGHLDFDADGLEPHNVLFTHAR
jgi:hypothetical protein